VSPIAWPCVYLVTDRRRLVPDARTLRDELAGLESWLDEAIDAGVDVVQLRERDLEGGAARALTARVAARARGWRTAVLVNDRADVALAAGADGVHLRGDGPPVERVRQLGGAAWMVGRSIHRPEEAAVHRAADYVLFGSVFSGGSKPPGAPVSGLEGLRAAVRTTRTPVVAIGGMTPERAARCVAAGAAGVAGIGVFLPVGRAPAAMGAAAAVTALRAALEM
jgi:thiamine-phosphate diphosphorylase